MTQHCFTCDDHNYMGNTPCQKCIDSEPLSISHERAHMENCLQEAKNHIETLLPTPRKPRWLSPRGIEVEIIRTTVNSVTLMVYDNPNDPHEWTTTLDNFTNNYKPIDLVS